MYQHVFIKSTHVHKILWWKIYYRLSLCEQQMQIIFSSVNIYQEMHLVMSYNCETFVPNLLAIFFHHQSDARFLRANQNILYSFGHCCRTSLIVVNSSSSCWCLTKMPSVTDGIWICMDFLLIYINKRNNIIQLHNTCLLL